MDPGKLVAEYMERFQVVPDERTNSFLRLERKRKEAFNLSAVHA
jgi:hypothetical protein